MTDELYSFLRWLISKGGHAPKQWCKADPLQQAYDAGYVGITSQHQGSIHRDRIVITPEGREAFDVERKRREADEAGTRG
jgi:hypothetical protein